MRAAYLAAEAAAESITAGASMYPLWVLAGTLPAIDAAVARTTILDNIAACFDAWANAGHPPPRVSHPLASSLVAIPPKVRRLALESIAAQPKADEVIESLCDTIRAMSITAPFKATIAAPEKPQAPPPQKIVIENHLPEQPAPVVNLTNHLPEQPAPVVNAPVSVQMPDRITVDVDSLPERVTETTVTRDRDGNIRETVQIESDA